jgi:hypothetical protein
MDGIQMTDISERLVVRCPNHEASDYLAAFVADHIQGDGSVRMKMRLPISRHSDRRPLAERAVVGAFCPLKASGVGFPSYSLSWLTKGDGPSPEFTGTLAIGQLMQDDSFGLILSGHCAPRGTAGAKSCAGRRIARVSPRAVLELIAVYIENARAHNEAALAGHSPLTFLSSRSFSAASNPVSMYTACHG